MNIRPTKITKVLSANDVGETQAHQAGILVPKAPDILGFFPSLDPTLENPRCTIRVVDQWQAAWTFAFIYYNNRFRGGTRNEYRLTRMTEFFRSRNVKSGDSLTLTRSSDLYELSVAKPIGAATPQGQRLKLGTGWKVVEI